MAKESTKDFNKMLFNNRDMPKIIELSDEKGIKKWGGKTMVVAPPLDYDKYMKLVPEGKLITTNVLRKKLAADHKVDVCCPLTCGIFTQIAAWASFQRTEDITPYWRTLKTGGELNPKYPGGYESHKALLEAEGHTVVSRGKKYFVQDFEDSLWEL